MGEANEWLLREAQPDTLRRLANPQRHKTKLIYNRRDGHLLSSSPLTQMWAYPWVGIGQSQDLG